MNNFGSAAGNVKALDPSLLNHWAWTHRWRNSLQSRQNAERVLELAAETDGNPQAHARKTLAWHAVRQGQFDRAEELSELAAPRLSRLSDRDPLADIFAIRALCECQKGNLAAAQTMIDRGEGLLAPQSAMSTRIDLLVAQATVHRHSAKIDEANRLLKVGLGYARGAEMAYLRYAIARAHFVDGKYLASFEAAQLSLSAARRFENTLIQPYVLETLARCQLRDSENEKAENLIAEGIEIATENMDQFAICRLTLLRAEVALNLGQYSMAEDLARSFRDLASRNGFSTAKFDMGRKVLEILESLSN